MADGVSIRAARVADAAAIQSVARDTWHAAYDDVLGSERVDETVSSWYAPDRLVADDVEPADRPFFVAVDDGDVVGFVEAVPDGDDDGLAHLYRIYVAPGHWGRGVGSALLARIESKLRERGFERLQLSVMAANDRAVEFYQSHGFERTATTHNEQLDIQEYEYSKTLRP